MQSTELPLMASLAPLVDRMRQLAQEELPSPRSCKVESWDDGTFDIVIYHSLGFDARQQLRYERTTGEILWEHLQGARHESESMGRNETLHKPAYDNVDVRVVDTVEPPYRRTEGADTGR
jgi:hypothetical protein